MLGAILKLPSSAGVVSERSEVSSELALRLSEALGRSPDSWQQVCTNGWSAALGCGAMLFETYLHKYCRNSANHAAATKMKRADPRRGPAFSFLGTGKIFEPARKQVQAEARRCVASE